MGETTLFLLKYVVIFTISVRVVCVLLAISIPPIDNGLPLIFLAHSAMFYFLMRHLFVSVMKVHGVVAAKWGENFSMNARSFCANLLYFCLPLMSVLTMPRRYLLMGQAGQRQRSCTDDFKLFVSFPYSQGTVVES